MIKTLLKRQKTRNPNNSLDNFIKYLKFNDKILNKIPDEEIDKERNLRREQMNLMHKIIADTIIKSNIPGVYNNFYSVKDQYFIEDETDDFINMEGSDAFDTQLITLLLIHGFETMEEKDSGIEHDNKYAANIINETLNDRINMLKKYISQEIKDRGMSCIYDIHAECSEYNAYNRYLFAKLKPSDEFIKVAKSYGWHE